MPVSLEVRSSVAAIVPPIEGDCTGGFPLLFTIDFKGFMKIICCQVSPSFGDRQSVFKCPDLFNTQFQVSETDLNMNFSA